MHMEHFKCTICKNALLNYMAEEFLFYDYFSEIVSIINLDFLMFELIKEGQIMYFKSVL